jgi:hypothetical protein
MTASNAHVTKAVSTCTTGVFYTVRRRGARSTKLNWKFAARKFGQSAERRAAMKTTNTAFNELEDAQARAVATETRGAYRAEKF